MKTLIFDTETTGLLLPATAPLEKQPRIIELGIAIVENGKIVAEHDWLIYPEMEISAEITKITGITNADLVGKPLFKDLLGEIEAVFSGCDIVVAHNSPFDVGMVNNELARCAYAGFSWPDRIICSVQEYQHVFGRRPRLIELYEYFVGMPLKQEHRAMSDVHALYEALVAADFFDTLI